MGKKLKEVNILVLYNGTWKESESKWTFEGAHYTILSVRKRVTYTELLKKLSASLPVDKSLFDLKLEAVYQCGGQTMPPLTIVDDNGVSCYIRETTISVQHRTPLCVSSVRKDINVHTSSSHFVDDESESLVPETTPYQDDFVNYQSCQPLYDVYRDIIGTQVPETAPVQNTYFDHVHSSIFHTSVPEECNKKEEYFDYRPMFDLNKAPDANEYGYVNLPNETEMLHIFPPYEIDGFDYEERSIPHGDWKNTRRKGNEDDMFFRLPSFTADDVAGGSGPVDMSHETTEEIFVGQIFDNKKALKKAASKYAIGENFEFVVGKSGTDVWYIVCTDPKCRWRLRGKQIELSSMFKVSTFFNVHTCQADTQGKDHRQATPWIVADMIKNKIVEDGPKYLPRQIITDMKHDYGFEMTYEKAWRCKEAALKLVRGTPEASYAILPSYLYTLQEKNPCTIQDVVTDDDGAFKYCFFSLGASRQGFRSCRPVICVDGTFLKSRFGGILLCAVALDADNRLYPIAVAVVDSENHDSWIYFMNKLKIAIGEVENLVFVSDRHQSIANALDVVFPDAHHGACYYHIKQNVHAKFKSDLCDADMFAAAYAFRRSVFYRHFRNIQARDPHIATYLEEIGKHKWARSYFPGNRYNIMTSNYAESLNNMTKEARTWPVTSLLEFIRCKLQQWFFDRREFAAVSTDTLSPLREKEIRELSAQARYLRTRPVNQHQVQVFDAEDDVVVNLQTRECTCIEFQVIGMPCVHAVAATIKKRNYNVYELCSKYYTLQFLRNTYADTIYPLGKEDDWVVPDQFKQKRVGVPVPRATIGRPKKKQGRPKHKRIPSKGERITVERRCSRCRGLEHNRATCTAIL